jgi:diadenosine tetraphosphatase ApaH/serine/threonine PP2A family protein phosphatase
VKLAIISDVHSNLAALTAVLRTIADYKVDAIYCLGDVVGYGPDPAACVDLIRSECTATVRGNHDEAVALERNVGYLPRDARKAAKHNRLALSAEQLSWLASRPLIVEENGCCFAHSSPANPDRWTRLDTLHVALEQFSAFSADVCFVGHTHIPAIVSDRLGVLRLRPGHRFLVNVGSVGQPRDQDPRASFGIFDTTAFDFELIRVAYDIEGVQRRLKEEHLPRRLGKRLEVGL